MVAAVAGAAVAGVAAVVPEVIVMTKYSLVAREGGVTI